MTVRIKKVRAKPESSDGYRVLVDRVWPRGVRKDDLAHDVWLKDVAPSSDLRRWFGHDPERFAEFSRRYRRELDGSDALTELRDMVADHDTVTLLFGAKDAEHNQAAVLAELLGD